MRTGKGVLGLGVAVLGLWLGAADLAAQDKAKAPPPASAATPQAEAAPLGWTVNCSDPGNGMTCKAMQTVVLAKTRQLLISIAVSKRDNAAAMLLHVPHGLFNPAGVTIAIDDGKGEMFAIQTCDPKGCYAGAPVTPERLAAMSKGGKLNVTFQDLQKKPITVPVPLKGFEVAYKKL